MIDLNTLAAWANILAIPIAIASIFISIVVSIGIYQRSRPNISLSCIIDLVYYPIEIRAGEALKGEIEIRYKKRAVQNLSIVRASLKNTGNSSIRKTHVVENITFIFPDGVEILRTPLIIYKSPDNINIEWQVANPPNKVSMLFELLNPGDELIIEFLCAGTGAIPQVSARIEGLAKIQSESLIETRLKTNIKQAYAIFVVYLLCGLAFAVYFYSVAGGPEGSYHSIPLSLASGMLIPIVGYIIVGVPFAIVEYLIRPIWHLIKIRRM